MGNIFKYIFSSKGIQGGIGSLLTSVLAFLASVGIIPLSPDEQTSTVAAMVALVGAVSSLWGIYGRYVAKQPLTLDPNKVGTESNG